MSKPKVFTIWRDPDGVLTLAQGMDPPRYVDGDDHDQGCVWIHQFEAMGLGEAVNVLHGWHEREAKGMGDEA